MQQHERRADAAEACKGVAASIAVLLVWEAFGGSGSCHHQFGSDSFHLSGPSDKLAL